MNSINRLLTLILLTCLFSLSYQVTYSYFSDSAESTNNLFAAASSFPTPTTSPSPTPITDHVVINEVNYKVDVAHTITNEANSEWFEIYNPTASPVILTGWSITDDTSCDNFPGTISLAPTSFAIVTPLTEASFESVWSGVPSSTIYITLSSAIGNGLANNERLILKNSACPSGTTVDQISWGNDTTAFNPGIGIVADGHSSERDPDGVDTDTALDFADRITPTPGS